MKKILSLAASLPIATVSFLGLAGSANAALLTGSTLNIVGGVQGNASGAPGSAAPEAIPIPTPVLPTGEAAGGANSYQDFLWVPTLPGGFTSTSLNTTTVNPGFANGNRLINSSVGPTVDAIVNGTAKGNTSTPFGVPGTLSFAGISGSTLGELLNLDLAPANIGLFNCSAADGSNCFLKIAGLGGDVFHFGIDTSTIIFISGGAPGGSSAEVLLDGVVKRFNGGVFQESAAAQLNLTLNGLFDNGIDGGDVVANDFVTGVGSYSATWTIVASVPEPSNVTALAITALGAGLLAYRKSRK